MYDKICPECGTKLSHFYRTYMLGCPKCYISFREEIIPVLREIHGATFHTGKSLEVVGVDRELLTEYDRLIKMREDATLEGRFSEINNITKQILELAEVLKRRGLM
jgi:protein arginine kinase activator